MNVCAVPSLDNDVIFTAAASPQSLCDSDSLKVFVVALWTKYTYLLISPPITAAGLSSEFNPTL